MITADQLVLHAIGDYVIQSDWMAREKIHRWLPALIHAATYALPFLLLTQNLIALGIIGGTHAVIDRYRLAKYVCWAKNGGPWYSRQITATGYSDDKPAWLAVWLLIIADNVMHVVINGMTLWWVT